MLSGDNLTELRYGLQALEIRRLMAVTAFVNRSHVLNIDATRHDDNILVTRISNGKVSITGVIEHFTPGNAAGAFKKIFINAGDGNDKIRIDANVDYRSATIAGADGNDSLTGARGDDRMDGGNGNDSLLGGGANDLLIGGTGNDSLFGERGQDILLGRSGTIGEGSDGADVFNGGSGSADLVFYANRSDNLTLTLDGVANDGAGGGTEGDNIARDVEFVVAGTGNDLIVGGDNNETLSGGRGVDTIFGLDGADTLIAGAVSVDNPSDTRPDGVSNFLFGGLGLDTIVARNGAVDVFDIGNPGPGLSADIVSIDDIDNPNASLELQVLATLPFPIELDSVASKATSRAARIAAPRVLTILGSATADAISITQVGDTIRASNNGTDTTFSATQYDQVLVDAGGGDDVVFLQTAKGKHPLRLPGRVAGGKGSDSIIGGFGFDSIFGGAGNDTLVGSNGNDSLSGGVGDDDLLGGNGADVLNGGLDAPSAISDGNDLLDGGADEDCAFYLRRVANLSLSLDGKANDGQSGEKDQIMNNVEDVFGGDGDDTITGSNGGDFLLGGKGDDVINGGTGNDKIIGSSGKDQLIGGAGADIVTAKDGFADQIKTGTPTEFDTYAFDNSASVKDLLASVLS